MFHRNKAGERKCMYTVKYTAAVYTPHTKESKSVLNCNWIYLVLCSQITLELQ